MKILYAGRSQPLQEHQKKPKRRKKNRIFLPVLLFFLGSRRRSEHLISSKDFVRLECLGSEMKEYRVSEGRNPF